MVERGGQGTRGARSGGGAARRADADAPREAGPDERAAAEPGTARPRRSPRRPAGSAHSDRSRPARGATGRGEPGPTDAGPPDTGPTDTGPTETGPDTRPTSAGSTDPGRTDPGATGAAPTASTADPRPDGASTPPAAPGAAAPGEQPTGAGDDRPTPNGGGPPIGSGDVGSSTSAAAPSAPSASAPSGRPGGPRRSGATAAESRPRADTPRTSAAPTSSPAPPAAHPPRIPAQQAGPVPDDRFRTHDVANQPPPLAGFDPLACDPALTDAVAREGAGEALPALAGLAALVGSTEAREHARLADTHPPVLRTHDRYGHRIDEVEFHPSWHWLMDNAVGWGLHGTPWVAEPGSGAHVARAAGFYLVSQLEAGHCCPISMTYAAVPALRADPALAARFEPGLRARVYQPGLAEPGGKAGLLAGMSMTEKQGGSDVRAGSTTATPSADGTYRIVGHKWFTSAPMNDLFLTLAQAPGGLTCFVLPRVLPDGTRNGIRLQRLKDKLGNRSNASAEIEYTGAVGWRLGEEGRGVPTIIEMVSMTRLDCVLGSAAVTRAALTEAAHHAAHRSAFGARLTDKPLMQAVLADLALESEAATALAIRLAGAADRGESALLRLALPAAKYLVCKRAPAAVAEALECLGGNGYVEESGLPRLYREAPLNSIWEGSGNVTALDVLRAVSREPDSTDAVLDEIDAAAGADTWFDRGVRELRTELRGREERRARRLAEMLALCLQGSLLLRHAPTEVAAAFVASRFLPDGPWRTAGTLPAETQSAALVERVTPT